MDFFFINNICEEKVLRKFTNFNKMNNLLWPETIEHKKYHSISTNINLSSNHWTQKKPTTHGIGNAGSWFGQVYKCGRVKGVIVCLYNVSVWLIEI
jgi:hypothetical protein